MSFLARLLSPAVLAALLAAPAFALPFRTPERISGTGRPYQLSRVANGVMARDAEGRLHVVYWSGAQATSPANPSFVYHQWWRPGDGWSAATELDESFDGPTRLGGRHPSLVLTNDDRLFVAWNDVRNSNAAQTYINNSEIYGQFAPIAGPYQAGDLRLTTTAAAHNGDNGYLPRAALLPSGAIALAWYDFHFNPTVSDLFLTVSDSGGVFNPSLTMADLRRTVAESRSSTPAYTVADSVVDAAGNLHLVWTGGTATAQSLYHARWSGAPGPFAEAVLATGQASFFDPAHITAAPNGDVWVCWSDRSGAAGPDVFLRRLPAGQSSFEAPLRLFNDAESQTFPDLEIDAAGGLHLAWVDSRGGGGVRYARVQPATGALADEVVVSSQPGIYARPTLLTADGEVYLLFEEATSLVQDGGAIWFSTTLPMSHASPAWEAYQ